MGNINTSIPKRFYSSVMFFVRMAKIIYLVLLILLLAVCSSCMMDRDNGNNSDNLSSENHNINEINEGDEKMANRIAVFETNHGVMEIELFEQRAPETTGNFIKLVKKGFYDGLIFHRVIKDFMIQGGDPSGDGTGGPGYKIKDEFHPELKHSKAGILSMANSGPDTGGSQFFITLIPTPWLDNKHAVFGQLIKGEDVLKEIGNVESSRIDKPIKQVTINKITIKD